MSVESGELFFDIREKPVGYQWGGKMRQSVACPVCSKPALKLPKKFRRKGEDIQQYAHVVHYKLDKMFNLEADFGAPCEHNETRASK